MVTRRVSRKDAEQAIAMLDRERKDVVYERARQRVERQLEQMVDIFGLDRSTLERIMDGAQDAVMEWVPAKLREETK